MKKTLAIIAILFLASCARLPDPLVPVACDQTSPPYDDYGPPTYTDFQLSSYKPGENASHTMTFDITECHRETYQAVVKYPGDFTWNGFLALGPAGTQIGTYNVDFEPDGTIDYTIPVRSIDATHAYAARFGGPTQDPDDATLMYTYEGGKHVLTTTIPKGGDYNAATIKGPYTERLIAMMDSGLITNPANKGTYTITADFTSVDPDTDGADDSGGSYSPMTLNYSVDIQIKNAANPGVMIQLLNND